MTIAFASQTRVARYGIAFHTSNHMRVLRILGNGCGSYLFTVYSNALCKWQTLARENTLFSRRSMQQERALYHLHHPCTYCRHKDSDTREQHCYKPCYRCGPCLVKLLSCTKIIRFATPIQRPHMCDSFRPTRARSGHVVVVTSVSFRVYNDEWSCL